MSKKILGVLIACSLLCLLGGCSRFHKTNLQILLPEGQPSARIILVDYSLDTAVAAVNNKVTFAVRSNKAVYGKVTAGEGRNSRSCQFIPDGSNLTLDLRATVPGIKSDDPKSVNYRFVSQQKADQQMATDLAARLQRIQNDTTLDDETRSEQLRSAASDVNKTLTDRYMKRVSKERDNYLGASAVVLLRDRIPHKTLDSLISTMSRGVLKTYRVKELRNNVRAMIKTEEGMPFRDFTVKNEDGEKISFSDYIGKGKYVLVAFWASWCKPFFADLPSIKDAYFDLDDDKFTVLGVSVWDTEEDSRAAAKKNRMTWDCIHGASAGASAYGIYRLPYLILFGPDGTILRRNLPADEIVSTVASCLDQQGE